MGRFKIGDATDKGLCAALVHDYALARDAFERFAGPEGEAMILKGDYHSKLRAYNSYAELVCRLYEFYMGAFSRDALNTNLKWSETDARLVGQAQNYFDSTMARIKAGYNHPTDNAIEYYDVKVPADFGQRMREIRNNHNHSDYRRLNSDRLTLNEFLLRYNKYLIGLLHQGAFWYVEDPSERPLAYIEEFGQSV